MPPSYPLCSWTEIFQEKIVQASKQDRDRDQEQTRQQTDQFLTVENTTYERGIHTEGRGGGGGGGGK